MDRALNGEEDKQDSETVRKTSEIQIQEQLLGNRICDTLKDVVTTETGSDPKGSYDITQEPSKERGTGGRSGKLDDTPQCTSHVSQERAKAPATKLKSTAASVRNFEPNSIRRLPVLASLIPSSLTHTRPSLSPCVLPSFYGSVLGHRIRTPHSPQPHRAKTLPAGSFSFDKRAIKPATQRPLSLVRTGIWHVFKMEPKEITGPRPELTSCERWGPLPRKTKTTKTFVWGPRGPQESKSVCEIQAQTNRWRGVD